MRGPDTTLDHRSFTDHRARVIPQIALDEASDVLDLMIRDRRELAIEGDDADDARAFEDGQADLGVEASETVAGKQGPSRSSFSDLSTDSSE